MTPSPPLTGLLNASMGNVPELIISIVALKENQIQVVQSSLLGSILSNLLLVLGSSFFIGGLRHTEQEFNMRLTNVSGSLLVLAAMCITLPTVLVASENEMYTGTSAKVLSRVVSIFLLLAYCAFMLFQLYTHTHLFDDDNDSSNDAASSSKPSSATLGGSAGEEADDDDEEEAGGGGKGPHAGASRHRVGGPFAAASSGAGGSSGAAGAVTAVGDRPPRHLHHSGAAAAGATMELSVRGSGSPGGRDRRHSAAEAGAMLSNPFQALPSRAHYAKARGEESFMRGASTTSGLVNTHSIVAGGSAVEGNGGAHGGKAVRAEALRQQQLSTGLDDAAGGGGGSDDGDEDKPPLNLVEALVWLCIVSGAIAVLSEALVDSIDDAAISLGIPLVFVSCILLPIAGNAAEHASALIFAWRDRLDVSIGVAVGSATQIAMFVLPLCVLAGWGMDRNLTLDFGTVSGG